MSATFRELQRFAAIGLAAPGMTALDRQKAYALSGGGAIPENTITGPPPLTFRSDGTPLASIAIEGAAGGVGDPTANLFGEVYPGLNTTIKYTPVQVGEGTFTLSTDIEGPLNKNGCIFFLAGNVATGANYNVNGVVDGTPRTVTAEDGYVTIGYRQWGTGNPATAHTMLNAGAEPLPYEPAGYKVPVTIAGQTQTAYTAAQLGAEDWLTISEPTITPEKGSNTLTVSTTTQPTAVTITGHVK